MPTTMRPIQQRSVSLYQAAIQGWSWFYRKLYPLQEIIGGSVARVAQTIPSLWSRNCPQHSTTRHKKEKTYPRHIWRNLHENTCYDSIYSITFCNSGLRLNVQPNISVIPLDESVVHRCPSRTAEPAWHFLADQFNDACFLCWWQPARNDLHMSRKVNTFLAK